MSMYGPPGGPYPGQPQDPWEADDNPADQHHSRENYPSRLEWGGFPPASPGGYSQQPYRSGYDYPRSYSPGGDAGYADPSYADPRYGDQDYGDQSFGRNWPPPPPPARRGRGGLIAVGVVVVLLAIGGVGSYLLYQGNRQDRGNHPGGAVGSPAASPRPTVPSSNSVAPPSTTPGSASSTGAADEDARLAKAGDCLVNRGTENQPAMKKVTCAANTYQVLKRIDGTADKAKCNGTPNLTDWYFYDHPDNSRDFVLCLHKR